MWIERQSNHSINGDHLAIVPKTLFMGVVIEKIHFFSLWRLVTFNMSAFSIRCIISLVKLTSGKITPPFPSPYFRCTNKQIL